MSASKSASSSVTFRPAPHGANPINTMERMSSGELFHRSCPGEYDECAEILQSFIGRGPEAQSQALLLPATEGLVSTIAEAYNNHRALVLRPDDVWIAVLGQFHLYVNAHAEELRQHFVAHEGKQKVVVSAAGCRYSVDFGVLAHSMTKAMDKFIIDPSLRDWVLPRFSTTTHTDTVTAAVVMMATLKAYFDYGFMLACGIPQVTLEGCKRDWEEILHRAAKLTEYGEETAEWFKMLQPVLARFVHAFDGPDSDENLDFWRRVMHYSSDGSGPTYLSGWVTAFCFFDNDGKRTPRGYSRPEEALVLDGVNYPFIDSSTVPRGYAEVDVHLNDNGQEFETKMVAGLVATSVSSSGDKTLSPSGRDDVIAPVPGWWIYVKKDGPEQPVDPAYYVPGL